MSNKQHLENFKIAMTGSANLLHQLLNSAIDKTAIEAREQQYRQTMKPLGELKELGGANDPVEKLIRSSNLFNQHLSKKPSDDSKPSPRPGK